MAITDGYDPPQPLNQYRPYGDFGPVCDSLAPLFALPAAVLDGAAGCKVDADCPPGYICVNGVCVPDGRVRVWPPEGSGWPEPSPRINCKERIRDDGTVEYYDCLVDVSDFGTAEQYDSRCILVDGVCLNWQRNSYLDLQLPDPDPAPSPDPYICRPFDPDINIRPVNFTLPSGVTVTKYAIAGSLLTTYEVSGGASTSGGKSLSTKFSDDGRALVITGSGVGVITFEFEWDDNPSTDGTALGTIEITNGFDTITFTQSSGVTTGNQIELLDISPGTYSITYTNLNAANNPIRVEDGGKKLCFYDSAGDDCNAQLRIAAVDAETGFAETLWSQEADKYAVWVNAAECTLPCDEQSVTYTINFSETATYHFEFGADDVGELYFDNEVSPFLTASTPNLLNPNVFDQAIGPAKTSRVITAGEHEIVVNCTNGSITPIVNKTYYFGTSTTTNTGSVTSLATYNNFTTTSSETTAGYYLIPENTYAYHNFSSDTLEWWENKNDDPVTDDFTMTGGSGSGLILNLTLAPQIGTDAGNLCTRIRINEIVSAGTGYEVGDLLSIPGYPFETPPFRIGEVVLDEWYTNFQSSNAVFIRTANQPGWTNNGGSNGNEVAGLDVPSDSPTGKYLSFGVIDEEGDNQPLVTLRTCQFDLDLSGAIEITLYVCAGSDYNGGEIPNNNQESLQFSFDNSSWVKPGVSKEFAGVSRAQYADKYGVWYPYTISIPTAYRLTGQTVYFQQEITGAPEYMTGYNGLSEATVTSRYANGGDMYGIYKVEIKLTSDDYGCFNIHPDSYVWNINPGGWYIKICKDAPCTREENLPWVRCFSPWFDSLMQQYAVWTSSTDTGPLDTWQELNYNISVTRDDNLTLQASGDNRIQVSFNGTQYINLATLNQIDTVTIPNVTAGEYILTMRVMNDTNANGDNGWSGNPGGGAWKLTYSNGDIIRTSADLSQSGSNNLYWHTRMASGYRYTTVPQGNESE